MGSFFTEGFESVGVGKILITDGGHGGGEEGVPVEKDVIKPQSTDQTRETARCGTVFRVRRWFCKSAKGGLDGGDGDGAVQDPLEDDGSLIHRPYGVVLDSGLDFGNRSRLSGGNRRTGPVRVRSKVGELKSGY